MHEVQCGVNVVLRKGNWSSAVLIALGVFSLLMIILYALGLLRASFVALLFLANTFTSIGLLVTRAYPRDFLIRRSRLLKFSISTYALAAASFAELHNPFDPDLP